MSENIVDGNSQAKLFACGHQVGQIGFERRVAAHMLSGEVVVDINPALVGRRFSSHEVSLPRPASGDDYLALIVHPSDMVTDLAICEDVIV